VRQIIDEMMLGDAKRVEAEILGKLRLVNRILVHPLRGITEIGPVTRQIETKAHRHLLSTGGVLPEHPRSGKRTNQSALAGDYLNPRAAKEAVFKDLKVGFAA
jgi:hypothetical protein